jgi:N-acetyl-gamma-glutamyl-phosphate reductase
MRVWDLRSGKCLRVFDTHKSIHTITVTSDGERVVTARYDERTGYVMVLAALDNIAKGASGGAVQAMNVALGIEETLGLNSVGMYP